MIKEFLFDLEQMNNCVVFKTEVKSLPEVKLIDKALFRILACTWLEKVVIFKVQHI